MTARRPRGAFISCNRRVSDAAGLSRDPEVVEVYLGQGAGKEVARMAADRAEAHHAG